MSSSNTGKAAAGGAIGIMAIVLRMCGHESGAVAHEAETVLSHEVSTVGREAENGAAHSSTSTADYASGFAKDKSANEASGFKEGSSGSSNFENEKITTESSVKQKYFTGIDHALEVHGDVVISDDKLTEQEIKSLSEQNVKFICSRKMYNEQSSITNFKILYVYSDEKSVLQGLYNISEDQAKDVIDYSSTFVRNQIVTSVASSNELSNQLNYCHSNGITPIVVFHNKNERLFNAPIEDFQMTNVITCNSYRINYETFFKSTDYIDLQNVIKSLNTTLGKDNQNLFEFYSNFSTNYSNNLSRDKNIKTTIVAATLGGTGIGAGFIIYYNKENA